MIELFENGGVDSEQQESKMLVEAQALFEEYRERYPGLGTLLESPEMKDNQIAASTLRVIKNQEEFMENAKKAWGESTVVSNLGDLAPRIVDIVRVAYPNSIAHLIASVQPLDRLTGQILVVKPKFASTDAGVTSGDEIFANQTDGTYASTLKGISVGTSDGSTTTYSNNTTGVTDATLKSGQAGAVKLLHDGIVVAEDDGAGLFAEAGSIASGLDLTSSAVDYANDDIDLVYTTAPVSGTVITLQASIDVEAGAMNDNNYLREIDLGITVIPVVAKEHPLRLRWSEQARLVAMASAGIDVDDTVTNTAGMFLKVEKDRVVINEIRQAAGAYNATIAFDAGNAPSGVTNREYFADFIITLGKGENVIFSATGRGEVTWIIAGTDCATLISSLPGFVPEANIVPIGAHVIGRLGNKIVIKDPALPQTEYIIGFNGVLVGDTGVVIADWIPVYFTPTLVTSDLKGSKAMLSMYDTVVNEQSYYVRGQITNV